MRYTTGDDQVMIHGPEIRRCPRCGYQGEGIPYFGKGSHLALVIGLVVMTAWMFGAAGLAYYLLRRNHRVCPRCGLNWGVDAEGAPVAPAGEAREEIPIPSPRRENVRSGWGVLLVLVTLLFVGGGLVTWEPGAFAFAAMSLVGAILAFQGARRERDVRRAALMAEAQARVLRVASDREGTLTVSEAAAALGWTIARAERVLESLEDGFRVRSDVTDDGRIVYEFRELRRPDRSKELGEGEGEASL